jgi:hypothetical protein
MPIFEVTTDKLNILAQTNFASTGLKERSDLQRLLRDQIDVVAPGVLVIAEEFGEWTDSRRRIDLLGLDENANIVVIELKRTDDGGHMELQAVRYAAMVSTLTAARAIEIFKSYLRGRGRDDDPEQLILDFLGWTEVDEDNFGQDVRMILVSADFSRELTTAVIWLNEKDLDIRCVRIRPYAYEEKVLIDVQQVIPLPETADYQVQVREKKRQEREARKTNMDFTRYDVTVNGQTHTGQWKRNSILLVVKALVETGVSLLEIRDLFRELGRGTVFFEVRGEIGDVQEFCSRASERSKEAGKSFNERRWHTGDGDLIVFDGNTYAFSNQWGRHWPKFMKELKERYPQIGLSYEPSDAIS